MSYMALYRKFRPMNFSEMYGQEHITKTLKNQIINGRVGHAYLFSGGRGTGKTSSAKILSRAVNCLNPQDGEPCNECEICKGILSGGITDVVEMDAASNNSVDNIRAIREEVAFLPTVAKYRVYIIDEVHMLSTGAFNALLKTLEEPPEHVIFILATTEPQKLPATILSRCQRFDYKRIPMQEIKECLRNIAKETNVEIEDEALQTIAVLAEGAMRDGISILERCIIDGKEKITAQYIKELVGIPDSFHINNLLKNILEYNPEAAIEVVEGIIDDGKDLLNFLWETIKYTKDVLLAKSNAKLELYSGEEIKQIEELSKKVSAERLINIISELSETANNLKKASLQSIILEASIIKLCQNSKPNNIEELSTKIEELEDIIKSGKVSYSNNIQTMPDVNKNQKENFNAKQPNISKQQTKSVNAKVTNEGYLDCWPDVVKELKDNGKILLYTNLINTRAKKLNDLVIGIEFPANISSFGKTVIARPENMQALSKAILNATGQEMQVKCLEKQENTNSDEESLNNFTQNFDIPINIIEE